MDVKPHLVTAPAPLKAHELFEKANWSQVLFLTYSFDLPFFESYLLPKLVQNGACAITVVADAAWLAGRLPGWIESGEVREAGRSYILCGARVPGSFHPKLMLAISEQSGTVLVGSGNLSTFGMTTGGELFALETWGAEIVPELAQQAWSICRQIGRKLVIDPLFAEQVEAMGRRFPKLALATDGPLLHNLDLPILDQFMQRIGGRTVQEVLLWAPFTDRRLEALKAVVQQLQPQTVTLAVQPELTSLDGAALAAFIAAHAEVKWNIVALSQHEGYGLIHAKGVLVTLRSGEEWLLAGSPNLSTPALLRTAADGNYELARCIRGRELRSRLFAADGPVILGAPLVPDDLRWKEDADAAPPLAEQEGGVQLLGASWDGRALRLTIQGTRPADAQALIDGQDLLPLAEIEGRLLVQGLGDRAPVSVVLVWSGGRSGPIIVSNLPRLQAATGRAQSTVLAPLEALDYGDESELIEFLEQLAQLAICTQQDIARMLRGTGAVAEREETEEANGRAPLVDLSDIDFNRVRQHPRASAYDQSGGGNFDAPRIQLWLDQIVQQFDMLRERQLRLVTTPVAGDEDDETEPDSMPVQRRRWAVSRRIRIRVYNRVRRYILGLRDPEFWRLVGPDWMAANYSIFLQVLHTLWARLQEPQTAILSQDDLASLISDVLKGFWGCDEHAGYWSGLSESETIEVGLQLIKRRSDGLTMAMVDRLLRLPGAHGQLAPFVAAGVARAFDKVGLLTTEAASRALIYLDRPDQDPRRLCARIEATTHHFTWGRFCDVLARRHKVFQVSLRSDLFDQGDTLMVKDKSLPADHPAILTIFAAWIHEERRQNPRRSIFQMVWNSAEHVFIYMRNGRELIWRQMTPQGKRETSTLAQGVEPTDFARWHGLVAPLTPELRQAS